MEMHQVRYFLAVAEELNFTRAAERCNVAQPSLTRAIKLLEGELGGPLFNREREHASLRTRTDGEALSRAGLRPGRRGEAPGARFRQAEEDGPQARRDVHD